MTLRSSLVLRYRRLGSFERFGVWAGVASILGLVVSVLALNPHFLGHSEEGLLLQTGTIDAAGRAPVSDPQFDVYYPIPYVSPPELTWINMPYDIRVLEQRPDGFRVQFTGTFYGNGPPKWQARGVPKRPK
jgi:hypothetical protein